MHKNIFKIALLLTLGTLTGCTGYELKTYYDDFKKCNACSIHNFRLTTERSFFHGTRSIELDIDKYDNGIIQAHFSIRGVNKDSFFKPSSQILIKTIKGTRIEKEFKLTSNNSVQNKSWETANYGYKGMYVGSSGNSLSIFSTEMTEEQILSLANADKVVLALETINEPLKTEINKEDLPPLQEFVQKCFKGK